MRGDRARDSKHSCILVAASWEARKRKMKEGRQWKIFVRQCTCEKSCHARFSRLPAKVFTWN
jgi:hypothetical protein